MIGFLGLFFLFGLTLANESAGLKQSLEEIGSPEVQKMLKAISKNKIFFDSCEDFLGADLENMGSCETLVEDIAKVDEFATQAGEDALSLYGEMEEVLAKFNTCSSEPFFKQVACFEETISKTQSIIAEAKADADTLVPEAQTLIEQVKSDIASCFQNGFTAERLETKMSLCKLNFLFSKMNN